MEIPTGWQELLALKAFHDPVKITIDNCFSNVLSEKWCESAPFPWIYLLAALLVWGSVAVFIGLSNPQRILKYMIVFTIVGSIGALLISGKLMSIWHRGALTYNRVIILPDKGGALIDSSIQMRHERIKALVESDVSPWGVRLNLDQEEKGSINLGNTGVTKWEHRWNRSIFAVRSGDKASLNLTAWSPDLSVQIDRWSKVSFEDQPSSAILVIKQPLLWDGQHWWILKVSDNGNRQWRIISASPSWFRKDQEWLLTMPSLDSEWLCMAGYGMLPSRSSLRIQDYEMKEISWAMPFRKSDIWGKLK